LEVLLKKRQIFDISLGSTFLNWRS